MRARPLPVGKRLLERTIAEIRIEVARAAPAQGRAIHFHLDIRAGHDGPPAVGAVVIERKVAIERNARRHRHRAAHAGREGHRDLVDVDAQPAAIPLQRAGADHEFAGRARNAGARALGHGPVVAVGQVEPHIERAVVEGIRQAAPARMGVVGRKHAANEADDRQAKAALGIQGIEVPPRVAARRNRPVEVGGRAHRRAFIAATLAGPLHAAANTRCAARRPESAAMGTPGPG